MNEVIRQQRLLSRNGKTIPPEVDLQMLTTLNGNPPTLDEGFDTIIRGSW